MSANVFLLLHNEQVHYLNTAKISIGMLHFATQSIFSYINLALIKVHCIPNRPIFRTEKWNQWILAYNKPQTK